MATHTTGPSIDGSGRSMRSLTDLVVLRVLDGSELHVAAEKLVSLLASICHDGYQVAEPYRPSLGWGLL